MAISTSHDKRVAMIAAEFDLNVERLLFIRYLVHTGRLGDNVRPERAANTAPTSAVGYVAVDDRSGFGNRMLAGRAA